MDKKKFIVLALLLFTLNIGVGISAHASSEVIFKKVLGKWTEDTANEQLTLGIGKPLHDYEEVYVSEQTYNSINIGDYVVYDNETEMWLATQKVVDTEEKTSDTTQSTLAKFKKLIKTIFN